MASMDMGQFKDILKRFNSEGEAVIKEAADYIKAGKAGIAPDKARGLIKMMLPSLDSQQQTKLQKLLKYLS